MKTKTFNAWTRKAGSNEKLVNTELKFVSKKAAKQWLIDNGYEIDGSIYAK